MPPVEQTLTMEEASFTVSGNAPLLKGVEEKLQVP
jgi:hypothetical protein